MQLEKIGKMLSNSNRIKIIKIVGENRTTTAFDCYNTFRGKYDSKIRRETIYRELERLHESDILIKKYDLNDKKLIYSLKFKKFSLNFINMKIKFLQ